MVSWLLGLIQRTFLFFLSCQVVSHKDLAYPIIICSVYSLKFEATMCCLHFGGIFDVVVLQTEGDLTQLTWDFQLKRNVATSVPELHGKDVC
jgi:hypothetical protein